MTLTQQAKPQAMAGGSAHAWRPRETLSLGASPSPGPWRRKPLSIDTGD